MAITTALERPEWSGTATDISKRALKVAKQNAKNLGVQNLVFKQQNLLVNDTADYDVVLANLPYVPKKLHSKPDLVFEPEIALSISLLIICLSVHICSFYFQFLSQGAPKELEKLV